MSARKAILSLEESVRTLVETGVRTGNDHGRYRFERATPTLQMPATGSLGAPSHGAGDTSRAHHGLEQEEKRLLLAASVPGKDVLFALLQAIAEGSTETLRRGNRLLYAPSPSARKVCSMGQCCTHGLDRVANAF